MYEAKMRQSGAGDTVSLSARVASSAVKLVAMANKTIEGVFAKKASTIVEII